MMLPSVGALPPKSAYHGAEPLFDGPFTRTRATFAGRAGEFSPDGQRFIVLTGGEGAATGVTRPGLDMRLVVNWFSELRAIEGR